MDKQQSYSKRMMVPSGSSKLVFLFGFLFLGLAASVTAIAAPGDDGLQSRIYHRSEDDLQKEACLWKAAQLSPNVQGKLVLEVFPADTIDAVEIQDDETTLPTPLVLRFLSDARFGEVTHPIAVGKALAGRLWLKRRNCMAFNFLFDPVDDGTMRTPLGDASAPGLAEKCRSVAVSIKPGMTRAEVEESLTADGGITVPFRYERYVIRNSACAENGEVVKVNVAFRPAGMSDAVYFLEKWTPTKQTPKDIVMRVSPKYLERPRYD